VLSRRVMDVDAPVIAVRSQGWELGRRWRIAFERPR